MRENPEGGKLDPAEGVCRRCKKNHPSVLSYIGKRTREDCDRGSEVGTVHNGRDGEGPVPLRKPKESGRTESNEKDFVCNHGRRQREATLPSPFRFSYIVFFPLAPIGNFSADALVSNKNSSMPYLCNDRASGMGKGVCCSGFG